MIGRSLFEYLQNVVANFGKILALYYHKGWRVFHKK